MASKVRLRPRWQNRGRTDHFGSCERVDPLRRIHFCPLGPWRTTLSAAQPIRPRRRQRWRRFPQDEARGNPSGALAQRPAMSFLKCEAQEATGKQDQRRL